MKRYGLTKASREINKNKLKMGKIGQVMSLAGAKLRVSRLADDARGAINTETANLLAGVSEDDDEDPFAGLEEDEDELEEDEDELEEDEDELEEDEDELEETIAS